MTKGYLSLAKVAARWDVCEDTARKRLASCPRIGLGRAVRYSIEGVEDVEREAAIGAAAQPQATRKPRRAADPELEELRKHFGRA